MAIAQGDIYWIDEWEPEGSEPGFRRPYVVVSGNYFNESSIKTVVVCGISTNPASARHRGNVVLDAGEAGFRKQSIVSVTQLLSTDKTNLIDYIGRLSATRVRQILRGLRIMLEAEPDSPDDTTES